MNTTKVYLSVTFDLLTDFEQMIENEFFYLRFVGLDVRESRENDNQKKFLSKNSWTELLNVKRKQWNIYRVQSTNKFFWLYKED